MHKLPERAFRSPEVLNTLHTGFTVADLRSTLRLLSECFGFECTEPHSPPPETLAAIIGLPDAKAEIAYVTIPNHQLELLQYHAPAAASGPVRRPCDVGFAHIAFYVDDVVLMAERAATYGFRRLEHIPTIQHGRNAGKKATYLYDDVGFVIELMGP